MIEKESFAEKAIAATGGSISFFESLKVGVKVKAIALLTGEKTFYYCRGIEQF